MRVRVAGSGQCTRGCLPRTSGCSDRLDLANLSGSQADTESQTSVVRFARGTLIKLTIDHETHLKSQRPAGDNRLQITYYKVI